MADDNSPDDDDTDDGLDLEGGSGSGSKGKADPPDDDDDDADDSASAGDTDKPAAKTYSQEDVDKFKAAVRKEREATAALRRRIAEMRKAQTPAADTTDAVATAREEAAAAEVARFKPVVIGSKAEALLLQHKLQNPTKERLALLVRNLDLSKIDIEDDGTILGLEEQVDGLVDAFTEMFTPPPAEPAAKPKPVVKGDAAGRKPGPTGPDRNTNHGEYLANKILNR